MNTYIFGNTGRETVEIEIPEDVWRTWVDWLLPTAIAMNVVVCGGCLQRPTWKLVDVGRGYPQLTLKGAAQILNTLDYNDLYQHVTVNAHFSNSGSPRVQQFVKLSIIERLVKDPIVKKMFNDYAKTYFEELVAINKAKCTEVINAITRQSENTTGIEPLFWWSVETTKPILYYSIGSQLYKVDDVNTYLETDNVTLIGTSIPTNN